MQKVMQFLQSGCRMSKIPNKGSSAKKRYFFISEDYRKILSCEMDDLGMPINRQKPSTSVNVKDIQKVGPLTSVPGCTSGHMGPMRTFAVRRLL